MTVTDVAAAGSVVVFPPSFCGCLGADDDAVGERAPRLLLPLPFALPGSVDDIEVETGGRDGCGKRRAAPALTLVAAATAEVDALCCSFILLAAAALDDREAM